jgi:hypothetical protein
MTDDDGSSSWLRRQFDMLPTGGHPEVPCCAGAGQLPFRELLQHRFSTTDELAGHPIGNLLIAALTQMSGDFQAAVATLSSMMALEGSVLPSTTNATLRSEFEDGEVRVGETAITSRGARVQTDARTIRETRSRDASRTHQRQCHRRWSRQFVHEHHSESAGRRHSLNDERCACRAHLRGDGAAGDERVDARGSSRRDSLARAVRSLRLRRRQRAAGRHPKSRSTSGAWLVACRPRGASDARDAADHHRAESAVGT